MDFSRFGKLLDSSDCRDVFELQKELRKRRFQMDLLMLLPHHLQVRIVEEIDGYELMTVVSRVWGFKRGFDLIDLLRVESSFAG